MAKTNILLSVLLLAIAISATSAFYCHRLVPRFITYAVTPCTYPCLVLSSGVHPHIVMQKEQDGTPCMMHTGFHQKREFGMCRGSICTQELHHKVLKRKKRFVLFYAIPRIIGLRKQSRDLQNKIDELKKQLAGSRNAGNENEDEGPFQGRGSGYLGVENNGFSNGEALGQEYGGNVERGPRNLDFPEREIGGSGISAVGSSAFGARTQGSEIDLYGYAPDRNSARGSFGTAATGTEDDIGAGHLKLG